MGADAKDSPAAALRTAAWNGDAAMVRQRLQQGVDVNVWDKWGRTALSLASANGHLEVVRILLQAGAWVDPHEDYDTYETPLIAAAETGRFEIAQVLCAAGANPCVHGGISQRTAESYARVNGYADVADYLRAMEEVQLRKNTRS